MTDLENCINFEYRLNNFLVIKSIEYYCKKVGQNECFYFWAF